MKYLGWRVPLQTYVETCRCDDCGAIWKHAWDVEDYDNDYAQCPECGGSKVEIVV